MGGIRSFLHLQRESHHRVQQEARSGGGDAGGDGGRGLISLTVEHIFRVAGPDLVVCLLVGEGAGARGVAGHHVEAGVGQLVEGLLQEGELEIVARGVALRRAVGIPALVERFPEHLLGQRGLPAHHDPSHPPELGIRLAVAAQRVGAPVADGNEAGALALAARPGHQAGARSRSRAQGRQVTGRVVAGRRLLGVTLAAFVAQRVLLADPGRKLLDEVWKVEKLSLALQPSALWEVVGQHQLLVPHVVQDVAEKKAVPVDKKATLGVASKPLRGLPAEHLPQERVGHAGER